MMWHNGPQSCADFTTEWTGHYGEKRRNPHVHRGARGPGAQPQRHRHRHSAGRACGRGWRVGLGQELAGARRALRGGQQALPRGALHLHAPSPHTGGSCQRRRGAACACGACAAPAPRRAGRALDLRHDDRAAQQPATLVLALRRARMPALWGPLRSDAQCGGRQVHHLPLVRPRLLRARR